MTDLATGWAADLAEDAEARGLGATPVVRTGHPVVTVRPDGSIDAA
ncbi:hypothetical protein [Natrinema ejinorense]|nr:hypothetical protein [Natrinema ejinorense]